MKYGFVRAAAASPKLRVADVKFNTQEILKEIARLAAEETEIAVFPELSLCGYTCGDLFFDGSLLKAMRAAAFYLAEESLKIAPRLLFFIGFPVELRGGDLRRKNPCSDSEVLASELRRILRKTLFYRGGKFCRYGLCFRLRQKRLCGTVRQKRSYRRFRHGHLRCLRDLRRSLGFRAAFAKTCRCRRRNHRQFIRFRRNRGKGGISPHACEIRFRTQPLRVCVRGCRAGRIGYRLRVCGALSYCGKRRNFKRKRFVFGKRRKRRNRRGIFKKRTPQNDDVQAVCGKLYARFCRFRRRKRSENTGNRTPAVRSRRRGRGREKRIDFIAAIPCAGAAVAACRG